eukprot:171234-Pelagomonas_calceolata.AAC.2
MLLVKCSTIAAGLTSRGVAEICLAKGPAYSELAGFSGATSQTYMADLTLSMQPRGAARLLFRSNYGNLSILWQPSLTTGRLDYFSRHPQALDLVIARVDVLADLCHYVVLRSMEWPD